VRGLAAHAFSTLGGFGAIVDRRAPTANEPCATALLGSTVNTRSGAVELPSALLAVESPG
jgi:hypothetical protein